MAPFLYRYPNTGQQVQAWAADDPIEKDDAYQMVTCLACTALHLVKPARSWGAVTNKCHDGLFTVAESELGKDSPYVVRAVPFKLFVPTLTRDAEGTSPAKCPIENFHR
jgi:hypothetical protein